MAFVAPGFQTYGVFTQVTEYSLSDKCSLLRACCFFAQSINIRDYVTGVGNMMTSPISNNTFHGEINYWDNPCRLALWASTRGTVASERR